MTNKLLIRFLSLILLSGIYFAACTDDDNTSTRLNVRMTDDPLANVQEVNIDLQSIIVITDDGRDSVDIGANAGIYNLLDYQGDLDTLIGSATINAMRIEQIRLVLGENNTIMVDSTIHDLKTPSAQQSGLKINVQADVSDVDVYNLLIDFDAEKSVVEQGNGNYLLKPVIKVIK